MNQETNQPLIEATVNSAIKRIQNDPERSMRNIVDMALMFCSNGRFQQQFLELAQKMLENEDSSYYRLIPDLLANTDSKRITSMGINVGYHSCTRGARMIRKNEEEQGFNVPWCISLDIDADMFQKNKKQYLNLLDEGQNLGIYTWIIRAQNNLLSIIELTQKYTDCAFILICNPQDINESILDEFSEIYNIMFAINYTYGIEDTCTLLRKRKFLYSVLYQYTEQNAVNILNDSVLYDLSSLHAVFSLFCAESQCPAHLQKEIFEYIQNMRFKQCFAIFPFDLIHDIHFIDEIISKDGVSIWFDCEGNTHTIFPERKTFSYNLFENSLTNLLKRIVPKS